MAAVIANEFTEATGDIYLSALDRDRPGAVRHDADHQRAVADADLVDGATGTTAGSAPGAEGRRHDARSLAPRALAYRARSFPRPAVLLALVPLAFILFYVVTRGLAALNLDFFRQMPAPVGELGGGMANAIVGSLIVTGLGCAVRDSDRRAERRLRGRIPRHTFRVGRLALPPTR